MLKLNEIYEGDCLELMQQIPDKSVDLIVLDPPYNIGKDKRWDKWKTVDAYVTFMSEVFAECSRTLKANGSFYFFHNDMMQIRKLMDVVDSGTPFEFKQMITWNKIDPSFKNRSYVQQRLSIDMMRNYYNGFTEYCLYYTLNPFINALKKSRLELGMSQNDVDVAIGRVRKKNPNRGTELCRRWEEGTSFPAESDFEKLSLLFRWNSCYEDFNTIFNNSNVKEDLRANSNVWLYPPAKNLGHITPKPVGMIENIILHSSDKGDVVLDCFLGSGTTAIAALNTNRNFIGIEMDSEYCNIARTRISEAKGALV